MAITTQTQNTDPEPIKSVAEQTEASAQLWGKKFNRFDPETGKPHENNREFFWSIVGEYPASKAGGNMNAPVLHFEVQRYWCEKFYTTRLDPTQDGPKNTAKKNLPWSGQTPDGELIPGTIQISMPDFLKQFKEE